MSSVHISFAGNLPGFDGRDTPDLSLNLEDEGDIKIVGKPVEAENSEDSFGEEEKEDLKDVPSTDEDEDEDNEEEDNKVDDIEDETTSKIEPSFHQKSDNEDNKDTTINDNDDDDEVLKDLETSKASTKNEVKYLSMVLYLFIVAFNSYMY